MAKAQVMTTKNVVKKAKRGIKVFPQEVLEVTYNSKGKYHKEGETAFVHPEQVKKLLAKGVINKPEGFDEYLERTSQEETGTSKAKVKTFGKGGKDFRDKEVEKEEDEEPEL